MSGAVMNEEKTHAHIDPPPVYTETQMMYALNIMWNEACLWVTKNPEDSRMRTLDYRAKKAALNKVKNKIQSKNN